MKRYLSFFAVSGLLLSLNGCLGDGREVVRKVRMEVTAYCSCGKCCGWKRTWYGKPVYAYGPHEGAPRAVGICADGSRARKGVVAADTAYYPMGTRMEIPGYGEAVVRDRGKDIKGPARLDVFFPRHRDALKWGRQVLSVSVYGEK